MLRLICHFIAVAMLLAFPTWAGAAEAKGLALVAGATGETGIEVVKALNAQGYPVRGLVRDAGKAKAAHGDIAEWVTGDVREPATLTPAFVGVSYVLSAIGSREREGPNNFENVDWRGNRNLIDAARAVQVKSFVLMTSGSAGPGDPNSPDVQRFGAGRIWKGQAEEYLRASGMPYAIVAPGGLRNYAGGTKGILLRPRSQYKVGVISRADVAAVMVACMTDKACQTKTVTVINTDTEKANAWPATLARLPIDTPETIRLAPTAKP
ncbi:MAG: SDR family oxidoreductase [Rhodospirillaceae bacterium]|nr:SDR family oxidoreductase [Rhodospirillaceae bacterium]